MFQILFIFKTNYRFISFISSYPSPGADGSGILIDCKEEGSKSVFSGNRPQPLRVRAIHMMTPTNFCLFMILSFKV